MRLLEERIRKKRLGRLSLFAITLLPSGLKDPSLMMIHLLGGKMLADIPSSNRPSSLGMALFLSDILRKGSIKRN
jgi:hypothetical protein